MSREALKVGFRRAAEPLALGLVRLRIHPTTLTALGLVVGMGAGAVAAYGKLRLAGILILFSGVFDILDGAVARAGGRGSRFGALLDSSIDRYGEAAILLGIFWYFRSSHVAVAAFLTLVGSYMVSYVKARGEGLGVECPVGWLQRPERMVILAICVLIGPLGCALGLWALAALSNLTAWHRLAFLREELRRSYIESSVSGEEPPVPGTDLGCKTELDHS